MDFASEVSIESSTQFALSIFLETVGKVGSMVLVMGSLFESVTVETIMRQEGLREFFEAKSSITTSVITSDKQLNSFLVGVYCHSVKSSSEVVMINRTTLLDIKHMI